MALPVPSILVWPGSGSPGGWCWASYWVLTCIPFPFGTLPLQALPLLAVPILAVSILAFPLLALPLLALSFPLPFPPTILLLLTLLRLALPFLLLAIPGPLPFLVGSVDWLVRVVAHRSHGRRGGAGGRRTRSIGSPGLLLRAVQLLDAMAIVVGQLAIHLVVLVPGIHDGIHV